MPLVRIRGKRSFHLFHRNCGSFYVIKSDWSRWTLLQEKNHYYRILKCEFSLRIFHYIKPFSFNAKEPEKSAKILNLFSALSIAIWLVLFRRNKNDINLTEEKQNNDHKTLSVEVFLSNFFHGIWYCKMKCKTRIRGGGGTHMWRSLKNVLKCKE